MRVKRCPTYEKPFSLLTACCTIKSAAIQTSLITYYFITPHYIAWIEGFAIFFGVFIVAGVGSYNDWQKEKQFLRLQAESEKDNTVSYSLILDKSFTIQIMKMNIT